MFKDKEINKKVKYKLGIFDERDIKEIDLERVTEIYISNLDSRGEIINTDLSELNKLKNLKLLSLKGFELDEKNVEVIKSFKNLVQLSLYKCTSKEEFEINFENLNRLILSYSNLNNIKFPEIVSIINGGVVDLSKFKNIKNLKELEINKSEIVNSKLLGEISELKSLNLDGSTLDNYEILETLQLKKIEISKEDDYRPIR